MFAKPTRLLILLVFTALGARLAPAVEVPELVKLRDSFEERRSTDLGALVDKYVDALKRLEKELADKGALEEALVVREYRLKVGLTRGEGELDEAKAPAKLLDLKKVFDKARDSKLAPLEKIYVDELGKLEKRLVAQDRLRDAVAVKKVRDELEAKMPQSTGSSTGPGKVGLGMSPGMKAIQGDSVLFWDFEGDGKRKVDDRSPANNDVLLTGVTIEDDPKRGRVAVFANQTDYILLNPVKKFSGGSITVAAWVRCGNDKAGVISYASPEDTNEFVMMYDGELIFHRGSAAIRSRARSSDTRWSHLAVTYEHSTGETHIYVDGRSRAKGKIAAGPVRQGGVIVIGQEQDKFGGGFDPKQGFVGAIDDIVLLQRPLSPEEIETLYTASKPR